MRQALNHFDIITVLFFVEKKEPKKATAKRCTARLADTP
jgi:hypothetical protein